VLFRNRDILLPGFPARKKVDICAGPAARWSSGLIDPARSYQLEIHLSIDRFEGDMKQIAVLLTDDGTAINFPKALLPKGARAGDLLTLQIERDATGTRRLAEDTRKVQDQLKKTDPGGDIRL
jgi:Protein of unknown function (DUF3006)